MLVRGEEDTSEGANTENFGLRVDLVVLLKLCNALLLEFFPFLKCLRFKNDLNIFLLLDRCLLVDFILFLLLFFFLLLLLVYSLALLVISLLEDFPVSYV